MTNIPAFFLFHVEKYVEANNGDSNRLWQQSGLVKENITPFEGKISEDQLFAFIEETKQQFIDKPIGIELGNYISLASFGLISRAIMSCTDFQSASYVVARYVQFTLPIVQFLYSSNEDYFELEVFCTSKHTLLNHIILEAVFANLLPTFKLLTGQELFFERLGFSFPKPQYSNYFSSKTKVCKFSQPRTVFYIRKELTEKPFLTANVAEREFMLDQCEAELVKSQSVRTLTEQVVHQIQYHLESNPTATRIAEHLHMSERSLRRQLADEKTSYRELLQSVRTDMAIYFLKQTDLNILQIALKLGYQETSNFRAAFKNWTGNAPSEWRRENITKL